MTSRRVIDILSYADMAGEECLHQVLGDFSCPLNEEVEKFLKEKAEQSAKLKSSVTYFVVDPTSGIVLGYFTLVLKPFTIHESKMSKTNIRLISRFAERNDETGAFTVALYLIAQIGKNYALPEECRISGGDLMSLALDKLRAAQDLVGGKMVMIEREADREKLLSFYESNGFKSWNARFDKKDKVQYDQMIRVLENIA